MPILCLTGGGTAGHVTPNIAIAEAMQSAGWTVHYIGSQRGIERRLITALAIPYRSVRTGKLRRYFSWRNFIDPFNVLIGFFQALWHLHRIKPNVVFSKGGFVAVPVVFAAWILRIPVICHESDMTPGLATRLTAPFSQCVCTGFEKTAKQWRYKAPVQFTGTPVRQALLSAIPEPIKSLPILFVFGGSLGAARINQVVREALPALTQHYQVIHSCGKGKLDSACVDVKNYQQHEYIDEALPQILANSHIVISRAGANSIAELLALKKPHILIPLPAKASRGDQLLNAAEMQEKGLSEVLDEDCFSVEILLEKLSLLEADYQTRCDRLQAERAVDATSIVCALLARSLSSWNFS